MRPMWPFRKKPDEPKKEHLMRKFIAGAIIGGAISSIIGKRLLEQHEHPEEEPSDEPEETETDRMED